VAAFTFFLRCLFPSSQESCTTNHTGSECALWLLPLLLLQMPDEQKCARADYVISTGGSLKETERELDALLPQLTQRPRSVAARLLGGSHGDSLK
jgi:hypothetical protein